MDDKINLKNEACKELLFYGALKKDDNFYDASASECGGMIFRALSIAEKKSL